MTGRDRGGIDKAVIDAVRARTSLVDLIGRTVALKRAGRDHVGLCPFHGERTPSFTVNEDKGFYHCFGCGAHGDAFGWVMDTGGLTFPEAVEDLAVRAGLQADRDGRVKPKAPAVARAAPEDLAREKEDTIRWARGVFARALPAAGTAVETYLRARAIRVPPPVTLRFAPRLKYAHKGEPDCFLPAMVAAVQGPDGRVSGVHRTYLRPDGSGKARVLKPKKMGGVCWGGAIRLYPAAAQLFLAEGIETALSVAQATGGSVWAAGSFGNMAASGLPDVVRDVVLAVDNDMKDTDTARALIQKATAFHAAHGRTVRVMTPPPGMDFNDVLQSSPVDGSSEGAS